MDVADERPRRDREPPLVSRRTALTILLVGWSSIALAQPAPDEPPPTPPPSEDVPTITVDGRAVDALLRPIANAAIRLEGGDVLAHTDAKGRFHLTGLHVGDTIVT